MNTDYNLKEITLAAFEEFLMAADEQVSFKPVANKWSSKEILGHLIDSATINHGRFVKAQFNDDVIDQPYDQEAWVEVQEYHIQNWHDLLITWRQLNLQIAYLMHITEEKVRDKPRTQHNLHQIAFKSFKENEAATLGAFMEDYVVHLKHHLGQIRALMSHET